MFLLFLQQLFPMIKDSAVLMKTIGLLAHKLLLHHQSKPSHPNYLLPLLVLCVSVPWHSSSVQFLFQGLHVTWQDQIQYDKL